MKKMVVKSATTWIMRHRKNNNSLLIKVKIKKKEGSNLIIKSLVLQDNLEEVKDTVTTIAESKTKGDVMTVKGAIKIETIVTIGTTTTVEITNPESLGFSTIPSTTIPTIGSITAMTQSFSFQ